MGKPAAAPLGTDAACRHRDIYCHALSLHIEQSLAGGSGSGLCSALMAALRDEYPSARLLSHCFWHAEALVAGPRAQDRMHLRCRGQEARTTPS